MSRLFPGRTVAHVFFCAYTRCCFVEQESLPKAGLPLVEDYGTFLSIFFESSTRQPKIKQRI